MNKHVIAVSGKQFAGKDTVVEILLQYLKNFKRIGIGDAIKEEYSKRTGLSVEEIEKNKSAYRPDLIALGDEGRAISSDYWLRKILDSDFNVIISDLRLKNELNLAKQYNAITIRVESSRENRSKRGNIVKENDLTETDLDDITSWDFIIENNSDYDTLKNNVQIVAQQIKEKISSKK